MFETLPSERLDRGSNEAPLESIHGIYFRDLAAHPLLTPRAEFELACVVRNAILTEVAEMCKYPEVVNAFLTRNIAVIDKKMELLAAVKLHHIELSPDFAIQEHAVSELTGRLSQELFDQLSGADFADPTIKLLRETFAELANSNSINPIYRQQLATSYKLIKGIRSQAVPARTKLANCNLRLVVSLAKQFVGQGVALEDLIGAGNIGLLRGIDGFNPHKGFKLSTYATNWIIQAIKREIENTAETIRVPPHVREILNQYRQIIDVVKYSGSPEPSAEEFAHLLGASVQTIQALRPYVNKESCSDLESHAMISDDRLASIDQSLITREAERLHDYLSRAMVEVVGTIKASLLNERTIDPNRATHPCLPTRQRNFQEIGEELNLSRQRVLQVHGQLLVIARNLICLSRFTIDTIHDATIRAQLSSAQHDFITRLMTTLPEIAVSNSTVAPRSKEETTQQLSFRERNACLAAVVSMLLIQKLDASDRAALLATSLSEDASAALALVTGSDPASDSSSIIAAIVKLKPNRQREDRDKLARGTIQSALRKLRPLLEPFIPA